MEAMLKGFDFKQYESKPILRNALEITEQLNIRKMDQPNCYTFDNEKFSIKFVAFEEPKIGDFIVYLKADDIYHCRRDVFLERNIVES